MQIKTISKVITTKMESWINSIDDPNLQKEIRKTLLVSGGSIASMLLNETVNDYDVYFQDINVLKRVMEYYSKDYRDIKILDGRNKEKLIADLNTAYEDVAGDNPDQEGIRRKNRYAITLRNLNENQLMFDFNGGIGHRIPEENYPKDKEYYPVYFSPNAISLSEQIQIVVRFWGDPQQIHSTFDFIHATNYFTFETGLVRNLQAMESILTKQLYYQGSHYPVTSIIRSKKFIKRGFNISAGEYLKILFQISQLDLSNPDILYQQLVGVDIAYFEGIINVLMNKRDEDPNFIPDSNYISTLINRMFNESNEDDL